MKKNYINKTMDKAVEHFIIEPIRESTVIVVARIVLLMFFTNGIYALLRIFVLDIYIPHSFRLDVSIFFLSISLLLGIFQTIFILEIFLRWTHHVYYLMQDHLIEQTGILRRTTKTYDLKNIKTVAVKQRLFGKVFNFGSIIIYNTAPNYTEEIMLSNIPDPSKYDKILRSMF